MVKVVVASFCWGIRLCEPGAPNTVVHELLCLTLIFWNHISRILKNPMYMLDYSVWTIHIIYIYTSYNCITVYILCSVSFNLCIVLFFNEPTDFPRSTLQWFTHQPFRLSRKLRRSQQVPFTGDTFCIPNLPVNTSRMWGVRGAHLDFFLEETLGWIVGSEWRTLLEGTYEDGNRWTCFYCFFCVCDVGSA